ncbi:MAG: glycosyltransferase [bacterium]|nr:glycosyltransferase [bacterium]
MKKILILTVLAGMGHIRAAEAIAKAIKEVNANMEVKICDPMATTSPKLQQFFNQAYLFLGNYIPPLWGFFYNSRILSSNYNPFKWDVRRRYGRSIKLAIEQFNPDLLVSTHPFIADAAGELQKKGIINLPLISVVTDYHIHPWGINKYIDLFILPSAEVQIKGIPEGKIRISGGLATDPKFFKPQDKNSLCKTFGIAKDHKVVLILCGGFGMGMGGVIKLLQSFRGIDFPLQLLVVVGKNEELKAKLTQIAKQIKIKTTIFGFVENMEELMSVCDLVVTKPGGTSISEALTKGLPIILTESVPGQEDWNVQILLKEGVAIQPEHLAEIPSLIIKLFTSQKDTLQEMQRRINEKFANDRVVYNVANEITSIAFH